MLLGVGDGSVERYWPHSVKARIQVLKPTQNLCRCGSCLSSKHVWDQDRRFLEQAGRPD